MQALNAAKRARGFTLIELMVAIAILAIIAVIAIPAYRGYIQEAQLGTAKVNADSIRIFLEDFQLENATYRVGGLNQLSEANLRDSLGWTPDGDADVTNDPYTYTVFVTDSTYDILVEHLDGGWIRCDDRMAVCCDHTNSANKNAKCP